VIERILACWVQFRLADALTAHPQERKGAPSELRSLQKRQESAGRCLTEAVKQLALARRVAQGKSKAIRLATPDLPVIPVRRDGAAGTLMVEND
jgi:hypothetical protein